MNSWRARLSIDPTWLSSWLVIALTMSLAPQLAYRWSGLHAAAIPAAATPPTCTGSHDFLVDQGRVLLQGVQTFDRLCILGGARVMARGDLTLHVGLLYVAPGGAVVGDGAAGYEADTHDCIGNVVHPNGDPGHTVVIVARHATINGLVSANGGAGLSLGVACEGTTPIGRGGPAGSITVTADDLELSGTLTAKGGAGGNASATAEMLEYNQGPSAHKSGDGGDGGRIALTLNQPDAALLTSHLDITGGAAGTPGKGPTGAQGTSGTVHIHAMSAADRAALPPEPLPPIIMAGTAPALWPLDPAYSAASLARQCGTHDLVVPAGGLVTLSGTHQYEHICVAPGGILAGRGTLTLIAQTIAIAPGGHLTVDGRSPLPFHWRDTGRYETHGACTANHSAVHRGTRGAAGAPPAYYPGDTDLEANPGEEGGALTIIARSVALGGLVTALGGSGQDAVTTFQNRDLNGPDSLGGGGGGSGGGVAIITHRLGVSGQLNVAGGEGGVGNGPDGTNGAHGSTGCVKLFADELYAPPGALPIVGSAFVDRPLPSDPVAPPTSATVLYVVQTHHTLAEPFLSYWRKNGGLPIFGYPRTEAFQDGDHRLQYTDRALLEVIRGQVQVAPLGRLLTARRRFPRLAPMASTPERLYFPTTGHTLSGPFLVFWQSPRGAAVLGAPISEVLVEGNGDGTHHRYPLQWFERGRIEYHPEHAGTPYAMELGLLGIQALQARGWLPLPTPSQGQAVSSAGRIPGARLYTVMSNGTVFASDGSRQWHAVWAGPAYDRTTGCVNIAGIAVADAGRTVYAAPCGGSMWQSTNAGQSWHVAAMGLPTQENVPELYLAVAPDHRTVYAAGFNGLYKTTDAGLTWSLAFQPPAQDQNSEVTGVALDPRNPAHIWLGTVVSGVYRSTDAGHTWAHVGGSGFPPHAWVTALAVSPFDGRLVYVSTINGLYRTSDNGKTWRAVSGPWSPGPAGTIYGVTFDPVQRRHLYVGAYYGVFVSRDGGQTWTAGAGLARGGPLIVSASHPGLAYTVGGHVYRTTDGGSTWHVWGGGDLLDEDRITNLAGYLP